VRAVNLLPRDAKTSSSDHTRVPLFVLAGGLAAVTVLTAVLYVSATGSVSRERKDLDAAQAALTTTTPSGGQVPNQGLVAQERANREAALAAALSSRVPLDELLRQLSFVLPADVWLTGLQAGPASTSPTPAAATPASPAAQASTGTSITIDGATYTQDAVARVLARLAVLPSLDNVQLTKSERVVPTSSGEAADPKSKAHTKKQKPVVVFSIDATYGGTS
jgi:Tfp pilus assembly protein PilN